MAIGTQCVISGSQVICIDRGWVGWVGGWDGGQNYDQMLMQSKAERAKYARPQAQGAGAAR